MFIFNKYNPPPTIFLLHFSRWATKGKEITTKLFFSSLSRKKKLCSDFQKKNFSSTKRKLKPIKILDGKTPFWAFFCFSLFGHSLHLFTMALTIAAKYWLPGYVDDMLQLNGSYGVGSILGHPVLKRSLENFTLNFTPYIWSLSYACLHC